MNNKVNDVFLDNDKELLVGDKIVLESDQGITNDEKDILESIFDKIKENNLENEFEEKDIEKRINPNLYLKEGKTIISIAFPYCSSEDFNCNNNGFSIYTKSFYFFFKHLFSYYLIKVLFFIYVKNILILYNFKILVILLLYIVLTNFAY